MNQKQWINEIDETEMMGWDGVNLEKVKKWCIVGGGLRRDGNEMYMRNEKQTTSISSFSPSLYTTNMHRNVYHDHTEGKERTDNRDSEQRQQKNDNDDDKHNESSLLV